MYEKHLHPGDNIFNTPHIVPPLLAAPTNIGHIEAVYFHSNPQHVEGFAMKGFA